MPEELGETVSSRASVRQTTVLKGLYERCVRRTPYPGEQEKLIGQGWNRQALSAQDWNGYGSSVTWPVNISLGLDYACTIPNRRAISL